MTLRLPLLLGCLAALAFPGSSGAEPRQGPPHIERPPLDPDLVHKADSTRRAIERRTYGEADKKEIRSCDRGKADFLKKARSADPDYAKTDKLLNEAKLAGGSPNDPAIAALLEKKFAWEKGFDEKYLATTEGKKCAEGEARRRKAVAAALDKDKDYQALLRRIAASSPDHL
jgi:hypothetical protein